MSTFAIYIEQNREGSYTGQLLNADGTNTTGITAGSDLRVKIGRRNGTVPELDLSIAPNVNGSVTTLNLATGAYTFRVEPADSALLQVGPHDAEVLLIDAGEANSAKRASLGVVHILPGMLGGVS